MRIRFKRGAIFVGGVALALIGCFANPMSAGAIAITPALIEASAAPGQYASFTITLTNDEPESRTILPTIQKFIPLGTDGRQTFLPPEDRTGLPNWTLMDSTGITLRPGERRAFLARIQVPTDATPGGRYEAIFFSSEPMIQIEQANVGFRSRIGALVLFTVEGDVPTRLAISQFRLADTNTQTSLSGVATVRLHNDGVGHIVPEGSVVIRNLFGKIVARYPINPKKSHLLPASDRDFQVAFGTQVKSSGWIRSTIEELSNFGLGRYSITVEGVQHQALSVAALPLTVVPWHTGVTLVALLFVLFIAFRLYRARLIRAMQSR